MRFTALAALLALSYAASPASARTWQQEWTVGAHPNVHVDTNDARIFIHSGTPGHVSASVDYTVTVWGFHTAVHEPLVTLTRDGDAITVSARSHANIAVFGGVIERFHIDLTLPPNCDVVARGADGSIESEPVSGTIDLETGDGHITAHGLHGDVRVWTGDGGIDVDGVDGALVAHTGDGHLHASGRFDALDARSGDGRMEVSVARGSSVTRPWSLTTGDGGITLRIPRNLSALLDASAEDGELHLELPITLDGKLSHHELRGELNGGTTPLRVKSGDGSITLALSE
ncbi:MAG TPA: DUF4097 family beta strand repeat-containing protein [Candidatus Acidoferrales bacterium]|nr:DUF4097 family beta strand repeat-containing protein [Candidatus Acidoferrales bacterium]